MRSGFPSKRNTAFSTSRNSPKRYTSSTRSKNAAAKQIGATSKSRGGASRTSSKPVSLDRLIGHTTEPDQNIFEDLGFPPDKARTLLLRSDLIIQIERIIQRRRLTQAKAARLFGVTQPRMSNLVRGKIDRFSIDMLITMLTRAGATVNILVQSRAA